MPLVTFGYPMGMHCDHFIEGIRLKGLENLLQGLDKTSGHLYLTICAILVSQNKC